MRASSFFERTLVSGPKHVNFTRHGIEVNFVAFTCIINFVSFGCNPSVCDETDYDGNGN